MGLIDVVTTVAKLPMLLKVKKALAPRPDTDRDCLGNYLEANASRFPNHDAVVFEGRTLSWSELNALANRYAHAFSAQGIGKGDTVSLMMENRIEYLATLLALSKLGAVGALINTNLRGRALVHCVTVANSKKFVFGAELTTALDEARTELPLVDGSDYICVADAAASADADANVDTAPDWALDIGNLISNVPETNPEQTGTNTIDQNSLYIYTSGTTGLPKAAVLSIRRHLASSGMAHKAGFMCDESDNIYVCLPLYHGTGLLLGVGAALLSGATVVLRRKFSASNFLSEVRAHNVTCMIYIGELCRYLMNTPALPDDAKNPLTRIMGNGLRPDIWLDFKQRYGIKRIAEFYGASEGNVSFANLLNKDLTVGMTTQEITLVRYNVDEDVIVRDDNGFALPVEPGEPGLLLGKITEATKFEGYTDAAATDKKVARNLLETGDAWFNSGDLLKTVDVGYTLGFPHYQFVDRVGDTFRWKSENVSTNEVGEVINGHAQVKICNILGVEVPGTDGRAGMAAITLERDGELDLTDFAAYLEQELPAYARPVFLRIQPDLEVTGTFKLMKTELRKEGYDINVVQDPVYVMKPHTNQYVALDAEYLAAIRSGQAGF